MSRDDPVRIAIAQGPGSSVTGIRKGQHRLKGRCPDGERCGLPVHCSQHCSRLESAEITAEMQANAKASA